LVLHVSVNVNLIISNQSLPGAAATWADAETRRRGMGGAAIALSEYDFSGVPERELRSCVYYEYSRESAKVALIVEGLRRQWREEIPQGEDAVGKTFSLPMTFTKFTRNHSPTHDGWFLMTLAGRPGYPGASWRDLKTEDREVLKAFPGKAVEMHNVEMMRKYPMFIGDPEQDVAALGGMTLATWEATRIPPAYRDASAETRAKYLRSGFFMVNLGYAPGQIVEEFKKWLLKRHPGANKPTPEKRGRRSYRDRLNALGALRLRFYCRTLSEAQRLAAPLRTKEHGLFYSDRTAWNRACSNAVKYFREVLDVKETDLPIHFRKGWQK